MSEVIRHTLSQVDPAARTAVCSVCGPIRIRSRGMSRHGKPQWRCAEAQNFYMREVASKSEKGKQWQRESSARYRSKNPEKVKTEVKKWKKENPERVKAAKARWDRENPERAWQLNAKARAMEFDAFVEDVDRQEVLRRYGFRCGICGKPFKKGRFEIDHIVPYTLGGKHSYENTQPAHTSCNRKKRNKLVAQEVTLPTS